jgi:hypothetical protein
VKNLVHLHRILGVVDALDRTDDLAAVVGRDPQAGERPDDFRANLLLAEVAIDHVQQVPHADPARLVVQTAGGQRLVDLVVHGRVVGHQLVGLRQVEIARGARGDQLIHLGIDQGKVAGDDGAGRQFVLAEELGGSTAVPVVQLDELKPERLGHGLGRDFVGGGVALRGTTRIVSVFHDASPNSRAFLMIALSWSIRLILVGRIAMRRRINIDAPIGPIFIMAIGRLSM